MKILITPADLSILQDIDGKQQSGYENALSDVDLKSDFELCWIEVQLKSINRASSPAFEAPQEIVRAFNSMSETSAKYSMTVFDFYEKVKSKNPLFMSKSFENYVSFKHRLSMDKNQNKFRDLLNSIEATKACNTLSADIDQTLSGVIRMIYEDCHRQHNLISPFPGFGIEFISSFLIIKLFFVRIIVFFHSLFRIQSQMLMIPYLYIVSELS
jgi:hypothetical protein